MLSREQITWELAEASRTAEEANDSVLYTNALLANGLGILLEIRDLLLEIERRPEPQ